MVRKNTPIRVGVLGLGRSGRDIHVAALRDDLRFTIAGVMDGLEDRLRQAREELNCSVFKWADDLLHSLRADLIINALPTPFHAPLSKDSLTAGSTWSWKNQLLAMQPRPGLSIGWRRRTGKSCSFITTTGLYLSSGIL